MVILPPAFFEIYKTCGLRINDIQDKLTALITENKLRNNAVNSFIKNVLFFQAPIDKSNITELASLGYANTNYCLVRVQLFNFEQYCSAKKNLSEVEIHYQKQFIKKHMQNQLSSYFPGCTVCSNSNVMVALIKPTKIMGIKQIKNHINSFMNAVRQSFPNLDFRVALSNEYSDILSIKDAFHETSHLIRLSNIKSFSDKLISYDEIGIYQILFGVSKENLEHIYNTTFEALINYDKDNDAHLMETLEEYFNCDCNLDEMSKHMYIHKNTIRYRLKKIEELTGENLKSAKTTAMFYYCISIKNYLKSLNQ